VELLTEVHYEFQIPSCINLHINIDGVPLFKSTGGQFWPILGRVFSPFKSDPFVIALYYGEKKPEDLNFLTDFVEEYEAMKTSGVTFQGKQFPLEVSAVICDAPARSFVKSVKGHTGYSGCERCIQSGEWNGRMTFPETNASLRSDVGFNKRIDEDHHLGISPLAGKGVGMVSQFVMDYMHLVCLGVMRRLLLTWISGPLTCRLGGAVINEVSNRLGSLKSHVALEFGRKPRSLLDIKRWKATELRQFLLYTGPVVLLGVLPDVLYKNFMLVSVGIVILLNEQFCSEYSEFAGNLLKLFVEHYSQLYGKNTW
jgi:hypothetical protein